MAAKKTKGVPLEPIDASRGSGRAPKEKPSEIAAAVESRFEAISAPLKARLEKPVAQVSRITKWVKGLRPYRVYINFSYADGNLRAAGMGFQALFAIFAAVWVGFSVFGLWLAGNPDLLKALVDLINRAVPGLLGPSGVIDPQDFASAMTTFGWTGAIAVVGLLWTAIGWLYYTRQAVRGVFGLPRDSTNYVLQKIRDLGLALAFGVVLLVSAAFTILSTEALTLLLTLLGVDHDSFWSSFTTRVSGLLVSLLLNVFVLGTMFRVLSRVAIPWRNLFVGSLLGSLALSGLSALGGLLLGGATRNPLLATFTVFVGLLIWFNFVSRVMLLSASWIAVGMADRGISARIVSPEQREAERVAKEHDARVIVAKAELQAATDELSRAGWFRRFIAKRKLARAQERLDDVLDEPVGPSH